MKMYGSVFFFGIYALMAYTKPYLTLDQQIALLRSRGLIISDEPKAKQYLSRIGYYRLTGYLYPFRDISGAHSSDPDHFKPGTDFGTVIDLYVFDKKLRLVMLDALERIEVAVRVEIALLLGQHGSLAHRDPRRLLPNFTQQIKPPALRPAHQEWLRRCDDSFGRSKEDFVKHFKQKYPGDYMPIWMAIELWEFGTLSVFFGGMLGADKNAIAARFGLPHGRMLESWLWNLNVVRNIAAHHSRLWNKPAVAQPQWPPAATFPDLAHAARNVHAQTRLYGSAAIARCMLRTINPATSWPDRLKAVLATFPQSAHISLDQAGFPAGWEKEPLWR